MELQRILARDSRSANEKAIQLYGKDVLIISSQRQDNQTELIVAVDLDAKGLVAVNATLEPDKSMSAPEPRAQAADEAAFVPFSKLFQSASAFAPLPSDAVLQEPLMASLPSAPEASVSVSVAVAESAPVPSAEAVAHQVRHDHLRSQEIVDMMRLEMAALRKEFSLSRQMMNWQDGLRLSPAVQRLSAAMSEAGMPAGLRALLTDSIQNCDSELEALPVMHSLLVDALSRPSVPIPASGVHALCGPSGAGKTSMVGRLAMAAAQAHGAQSQVMLSFADQRPGAWSQMQLLAAQSGVSCYRAVDSDTLRLLLEELVGKTVWIDTCGTDFIAQAQVLLRQHPKVLRHAVLPVDATVTSVQKILQNSSLSWSSLMLSKVDEAAYPWPLIKGLTEQPVPVSCMAVDSQMGQQLVVFDAHRLVKLALLPMSKCADFEAPLSAKPAAHGVSNVSASTCAEATLGAPVRRPRVKKTATLPVSAAGLAALAPRARQPAKPALNFGSELDIVVPTFLMSEPVKVMRKKTAIAQSALKASHG